jgi:hypothetical protein
MDPFVKKSIIIIVKFEHEIAARFGSDYARFTHPSSSKFGRFTVMRRRINGDTMVARR